jgi:hypothetical protein
LVSHLPQRLDECEVADQRDVLAAAALDQQLARVQIGPIPPVRIQKRVERRHADADLQRMRRAREPRQLERRAFVERSGAAQIIRPAAGLFGRRGRHTHGAALHSGEMQAHQHLLHRLVPRVAFDRFQ